MCDQFSGFVRLPGAGQNLQTHTGESVVAHSPPVAIAALPPPDSQDHLAYLHAAGHQQQRPRVKLPRPKAIVMLPVIPAPKTTASILEQESPIIQSASSSWQDRIDKLLGIRRLTPHAPQCKHDSEELSVATKVPWNEASQLPLPPISTIVRIPTSRRTDGPGDTQDSKDATAITNEVAADRKVSAGVSMPIADQIPASPFKAKSLQGKYERGQTRISNRARDETAPFEFGQCSPGSQKVLVSIPTDVSESLRVLLMSDKMLNTKPAPTPEAPKSVRPETILMPEDDESVEGSSDLSDGIFINLAGLGSKNVVLPRPNLDMSLTTTGHETVHETAVEAGEKYAEGGPARWVEFENEEPAKRSGGAEGLLATFEGRNDDKKSNEECCVVELDILENATRLGDYSILMQSKDNNNANRSKNEVGEVMTKCENAISQSKDKGIEKLIIIEDNNDIETRSHNEDIFELFSRLIGKKSVNSSYFDIQDGLLSNRIRPN